MLMNPSGQYTLAAGATSGPLAGFSSNKHSCVEFPKVEFRREQLGYAGACPILAHPMNHGTAIAFA
jgi:hypothetical protein